MLPFDFLSSVWPKTGLYCIANPYKPGSKGYDHHVVETIKEAATKAEVLCRMGKDTYFNIHTLKEPKVWDPDKVWKNYKTGKMEKGKFVIRVQRNMSHARSFFFDLDVDDSTPKKYATQTIARDALESFCREVNMPEPTLVSSGGGIHCYWILEDEIDSATWVKHAAQLKTLAFAHGLKLDPMRTTDTSSLLRVVGTVNFKKEMKRGVMVLSPGELVSIDRFSEIVCAGIEAKGIDPTASIPKARTKPTSRFGSNTGAIEEAAFRGPLLPFKYAVHGCKQLTRMWLERTTLSEPEWKHSLDIIKFMKDPEETAIKWSKDYPGASDAATLDKLNSSDATGPTSCAKLLDISGPDNACLCEVCPFSKENSNPKLIAQRFVPEAPPPKAEVVNKQTGETVTIEIMNPPAPFHRRLNEDGSFSHIGMDFVTQSGKTIDKNIFPYDLYPLARQRNLTAKIEQHLWRYHAPHEKEPVDITMPAIALGDPKLWRECMANHGCFPHNQKDLQEYMSAYIRELQRQQPPTDQYNHIGWINDFTEFVMPDKIIRPDGTHGQVALGSRAAVAPSLIGKKGTLEQQIELMNFYNDPQYYRHVMFIISSLGATIFGVTGHSGSIVNAWGEGGCSKSSALFAAGSFFGPPKKFVLDAVAGGATQNGRLERAAMLANLPFCFDEISQMESEDLRDMAYASNSAALTKTSSSRSQALKVDARGDATKGSLMLCTSNRSMYASIAHQSKAGTAAALRVFEMMFPKPTVHDSIEADRFLRGIRENYGHIGDKFLETIVPIMEHVVKRVFRHQEQIASEIKQTPEERFWASIMACNFTALEVAHKTKLLPWPVAPLKKLIIEEQLPYMRSLIKEEASGHNPITVLTDFVEKNSGNILRFNMAGGAISDNIRELIGRSEPARGSMWLIKSKFNEYCDQRFRGGGSQILKELHARGVVPVLERRVRLGWGTSYDKLQSRCFLVSLTHPDLVGTDPTIVPTSSRASAEAAASASAREHLRVVQ